MNAIQKKAADLVAAAIADERERCAMIAESLQHHDPICLEIAKMIRESSGER